MLLAIDIGNTNIHVGIFEGDNLLSVHTIKGACSSQTNFTKILNPAVLSKAQAVIASVNPKAEAFVIETIRNHLPVKPQIIGKDIPIPIPVLTEHPEKVGVDRLVNAIAAFERTKNWTIVVDAGTAITIDGISNKGAFLGGIIAPGMDASSRALHRDTAFLPQISVRKPRNVLGKNTEDAINSGIYWGTIGMVKQLIEMIRDELECQPTVIATGGNAQMLAQEIPLITTVLPYLTLEGIRITYKTTHALHISH
ncbi:MAG: type III pantothenate kinase [Candidatus Brocadia sp.]|nr:type III pantothenate kinase [Candidatus Brocadia sp.]